MFVFINYSLYKFLFSCYILPDGSCVTAGYTDGCCNYSTPSTTCQGMTNNSGSASCYCDHVCYVIGDCCSDVADIGCYLNTTGTSPYISIFHLSNLHIPVSYYPFVHSSYANILLSICPFAIYRYHSPITFLYVLSCTNITYIICKYVCIILLYIHNCKRVYYRKLNNNN